MVRKSRPRYESGLDYTKDEAENSKILLKERHQLLNWTDSIEIQPPNLFVPSVIANYIGSLPFCKFSMSPNLKHVAVMNHNRQLNIYVTEGDSAVQTCNLQLLEDAFAEYCLLEFSSSGMLLLSTRSCAVIDVFDPTGGYCYDIPLESDQQNLDLMCAVSCIKTVVNSVNSADEKYLDVLYVLQFNGTFSVYKIGRLTRYYKMWSVSLDVGLAGNFVVLPEYNLLLVASQYRSSGQTKPPGGLSSFRLIDSQPYVEPIRTVSSAASWISRFPFSNSSFTYLCSLSLSLASHPKHLSAVATNGDVFIFDIPSCTVRLQVTYISGPRPRQVIYVDEEEVCFLFDNGDFMRCAVDVDVIRESLHSVKADDSFTSRSSMVLPQRRELFILGGDPGSFALKEVAHQRTSLACRLWIYTLWSSFKQLVGMAVGDAATPLQMATCSENLEFTIWHYPTRTLQQLFEKTLEEGNYTRAKELAATYDSIDSDVILKREWRDICCAGVVTVEHVESILHQIEDKNWMAEECCSCDVTNRMVQKCLVDLGISLTCLSDVTQIRILHNARMLSACDDVRLYLELRDKSCLEAAFELAKRADLITLEKLVSENYYILSPYVLELVSAIPACLPPSRYEQFIPTMMGRAFQIEKVESSYLSSLQQLEKCSPGNKELVSVANIGDRTSLVLIDYTTWCLNRAEEIDTDSGLTDHSIDLLNISVQHGYGDLSTHITCWKFYSYYVDLCSLVNECFRGFLNSSAAHLVRNLCKLTSSEIIKSMDGIIDLLKWRVNFDDDKLKRAILPLLREATESDTKVLKEFIVREPDLLSREMIVECLCSLTLTGDALIRAIYSLGKCADLAASLKAFLDRGVHPTFRRLWESTTESGLARGLLTQVACCGQAKTIMEWETLKDDVVQLAESLYSDSVSREEAIELVARELVADTDAHDDQKLLLTLFTLDVKGPQHFDGVKLGWEQSAEIILLQCDEFMQEAENKVDSRLSRARFLASTVKSISPKKASEQLRWLDIIDLVQDLGYPGMPVTVKFAEPYTLLSDIISLNYNYRQGKKCAKLAVLLGISTPVATALSLCSLSAIKVHDDGYLKKYIGEVISKARDIPVVHKLCMEIIQSHPIPSLMSDIYACALLNSPDADLVSTIECIHESLATPELSFEDIPTTSEIVLDAMYTKMDYYVKTSPMSERILVGLSKLNSCQPSQAATLLSRHSSTAALGVAMSDFQPERRPWTRNNILVQYEEALRDFLPVVTENLAEDVPPKLFIDKAVALNSDVTPMDRISSYGVNRERFIEDACYRKETIVGLAMTDDEQTFGDAILLAEEFRMDCWPVHMASVEYALTSCSIMEAKRIIKGRAHLPVLRTKSTEFVNSLRANVLPLLNGNDKFIAYLSLFGDDDPEKLSLPVLKKILDKRKDLNAIRLFSDVNYLTKIVVSMPDKYIISMARGIHKFPVGKDACEAAAADLLKGSVERPPASLMALYVLLDEDEVATMDLVASHSLEDEISYLKASLILLEATTSPATLQKAVQDRLLVLSESREITVSTEPPVEHSVISRRRH